MKNTVERTVPWPVGIAARFMICALCFAGTAQAIQQGATAQGHRYAFGGVSDEELASLHAQRERFSLWVITAAKKSGAYLADVRVKVTDAQQRVVFDMALDGPWLLIDLPLGRYVVEARLNGETQQQVTTIHPGDHHQVFFYFGVDADVSPKPMPAPPSSPFDSKRQQTGRSP